MLKHSKIKYCPYIPDAQDPFGHPLFGPDVFIHPKTYLDHVQHQDFAHYQCPAWKSWAKNTWVFYSQFDAQYRLSGDRLVIDSDVDTFKEFMGETEVVGDVLSIQFGPSYLIWTENPNIWVEQIRYDREVVPAHFPLGKWIRPLVTSYLSKREELVKIKRGDPLWCIRFSGAGEHYQLECEEPKSEVIRKAKQNTLLKNYLPGMSWSVAQKGKCPFKMLWDK